MLDYLIVGSGLFGCVFAQQAKLNKKSCLILEKRNHPFGNCYTEHIDDICIHRYGPHIFHTSSDKIWNYVNEFTSFNNYIHKIKVNYNDKLYSFPINLLSLYQLWETQNLQEIISKFNQAKINIDDPQNLEEYLLSKVGEEVYYTFFYGYSQKQWGEEPKNLPPFIAKRIPIRLNFNDNYFNDKYQGIPIGGYSNMMNNMIDDIKIEFGIDYLKNREYWNQKAKTIVYTGSIDEFYDCIFGKLDYRSLYFEQEKLHIKNFQTCSVINYTSPQIPFTRIIEHKHFDSYRYDLDYTIITKEYSIDLSDNTERFYPINTKQNNELYEKYKNIPLNSNVIFGGRLGEYKYYNMDQIIASAIHKYQKHTY